jgi:hypothetical protein
MSDEKRPVTLGLPVPRGHGASSVFSGSVVAATGAEIREEDGRIVIDFDAIKERIERELVKLSFDLTRWQQLLDSSKWLSAEKKTECDRTHQSIQFAMHSVKTDLAEISSLLSKAEKDRKKFSMSDDEMDEQRAYVQDINVLLDSYTQTTQRLQKGMSSRLANGAPAKRSNMSRSSFDSVSHADPSSTHSSGLELYESRTMDAAAVRAEAEGNGSRRPEDEFKTVEIEMQEKRPRQTPSSIAATPQHALKHLGVLTQSNAHSASPLDRKAAEITKPSNSCLDGLAACFSGLRTCCRKSLRLRSWSEQRDEEITRQLEEDERKYKSEIEKENKKNQKLVAKHKAGEH